MRQKDYTPRARNDQVATDLGFGFVTPLIRLMLISKPCKPAWLIKPKPMCHGYARLYPFANSPAVRLAITFWLMLKCWGVTAPFADARARLNDPLGAAALAASFQLTMT